MRAETTSDWQTSLARWQAIASRVNQQAKRIDRSTQDIGWAMAASVGIPHDACCLHNASIDTELKGWCHQNPERLRVAKQAKHLVESWAASRKAERVVRRAWNKLMVPQGARAMSVE